MIMPAFWRGPDRRTIGALYGMIVAQARKPVFYAEYAVPDTLQGRFELIVLHLVLVLNRLGGQGDGGGNHRGRTLGQRLFDLFCRDLDDNLREMGVGDLAVPKQMRRFGEAFYGRQAAYGMALAATDPSELENALARNIFEVAGVDDRAARLARYARATAGHLAAAEQRALLAGKVILPNPENFVHA